MAGTMYRLLTGKSPARADRSGSWRARIPTFRLRRHRRSSARRRSMTVLDRGFSMAVKDRPATVQHFASMLGWGTEVLPLPPPPPPLSPPPPPPLPPPPPRPKGTGTTGGAGTIVRKKPSNWKSYAAMLVVLGTVIGGLALFSADNSGSGRSSAHASSGHYAFPDRNAKADGSNVQPAGCTCRHPDGSGNSDTPATRSPNCPGRSRFTAPRWSACAIRPLAISTPA